MEMIIGGAFQGKQTYAEEHFPNKKILDAENASYEEICQAEVINHFHMYIKKELLEQRDVSGLAEDLYEKNPNVILISDELGYGVVPIDQFDREYREAAGRVCTALAGRSIRVTRVVCGIGTVIKGEAHE